MSAVKVVNGFPNYLVYEDGRIFSIGSGKFLAGGKDTDGYIQMVLCNSGDRKTKKMHRLVAEAFLPNPLNLPVINHKDGNKTNNTHTNLEWCTVSHNTKEAYRLGFLDQKGIKNNACKYSDSEVDIVINLYNKFGNVAKVSRETGIGYGTVYSYIKGLRRNRSAETIP